MSSVDLVTLRQLYVEQRLSIRDVAIILQLDPRTVHTALIRGRIARRQRWEQHAITARNIERTQLDEGTLRRLYLVEERSIREIAEHFATCTATVHHALVALNIPRRKRGRPSKDRQQLGSRKEYRLGEQAAVFAMEYASDMC